LPGAIASSVLLFRQARWSPVVYSLILLVVWLAGFRVTQLLLLHRPIAPLHDVADFVHAKFHDEPLLVGCYGFGREVMPLYEPSCVPLAGKADLERLLQRARQEQRRPVIIYGYESFNRAVMPDGFTLLDDGSRFVELTSLGGIEPDFRFRVLRVP